MKLCALLLAAMLCTLCVGQASALEYTMNAPDDYLFGTGKPYAILRIASDRRYRDRDGNRLTDFISIKVRGPLAERCAEFAWKGCKLAAAGDFETISFADDPDRQPGFLIKATEVEFLSPRKVEEGVQAEAEAA